MTLKLNFYKNVKEFMFGNAPGYQNSKRYNLASGQMSNFL